MKRPNETSETSNKKRKVTPDATRSRVIPEHIDRRHLGIRSSNDPQSDEESTLNDPQSDNKDGRPAKKSKAKVATPKNSEIVVISDDDEEEKYTPANEDEVAKVKTLFEAVRNSDYKTVKEILESNPSLIKSRDDYGRTPLIQFSQTTPPLDPQVYRNYIQGLDEQYPLYRDRVPSNSNQADDSDSDPDFHPSSDESEKEGGDIVDIEIFFEDGVLKQAKNKIGVRVGVRVGAGVKYIKFKLNGEERLCEVESPFIDPEQLNILRGFNESSTNDLIRRVELEALNHQQTLDLILQYEVNIGATDNKGRNALMTAAVYGRTDIAKILISKGMPVNQQDRDGNTALTLATINNQTEIVADLLAKADLDPNNPHKGSDGDTKYSGDSSLMIAIRERHLKIVELLLEDGRTDVNLPGKDEQTPLIVAILRGGKNSEKRWVSKNIVFLLLGHPQIDVNKPGGIFTPLIAAFFAQNKEDKKEILNALLDRGDIITDQRNKDGENVLVKILFRKKEEILPNFSETEAIDLLRHPKMVEIRSSTDTFGNHYTQRKLSLSNYDKSELCQMIENGDRSVLRILEENPSIFNEPQNLNGDTPLMIAAQNRSNGLFMDLINLIKDRGLAEIIDPKKANRENKTVPIILILNNKTDELKALLDVFNNNLTEERYYQRKNPLMLAIEKGRSHSIVKLLLEKTTLPHKPEDQDLYLQSILTKEGEFFTENEFLNRFLNACAMVYGKAIEFPKLVDKFNGNDLPDIQNLELRFNVNGTFVLQHANNPNLNIRFPLAGLLNTVNDTLEDKERIGTFMEGRGKIDRNQSLVQTLPTDVVSIIASKTRIDRFTGFLQQHNPNQTPDQIRECAEVLKRNIGIKLTPSPTPNPNTTAQLESASNRTQRQ